MSSEPTRSLDPQVLEELYQGTGRSRAFMVEVAELFRYEAEAFVLGVDALSRNDQAAALHSLAGAARTVGMKEVARLALKGEQAVKDQESPAEYIASVKAALPVLSGHLDVWTAALPEEWDQYLQSTVEELLSAVRTQAVEEVIGLPGRFNLYDRVGFPSTAEKATLE